VLGPAHAGMILQDVEVHAGLDHRLPWAELLGVLQRCSLTAGGALLEECRRAAPPDWSLDVAELRRVLRGDLSMQSAPAPQQGHAGVLEAVARVRGAMASGGPRLLSSFQALDASNRGFVARSDFVEVLDSLQCGLSWDQRVQLAAFFAPAGNPQWVCYSTLLQTSIPARGDSGSAGREQQSLNGAGERWAQAVMPQQLQPQTTTAHLIVNSRVSELESDNARLREQLRVLQSRFDESAELVAKTPVQAIRRMQGEIAVLENRLLEQQATVSATSRKAEITLRSELEVSRHEVATLQRTQEGKDRELERYKHELEDIITELSALQESRVPGA